MKKSIKNFDTHISDWKLLDVETIANLLNLTPETALQFMVKPVAGNPKKDVYYIPNFTLFGQKVMTQKMFKDFIQSKGGEL